MRLEVLKALAVTPMNSAQIKERFPSLAKTITDQMLASMTRDGLIAIAYGKFRLTPAGRAMLPVVPETVTHRVFVPERVIRRAGSERASSLPSFVAGRVMEVRR